MKIVQINAVCGQGSTGKICVSVSQILTQKNIENYILYSTGEEKYPLAIRCSNKNYIRSQALYSRLRGNYGFNSRKATKKIIQELEIIQPDIVHLHNIHGHDCDLSMLFTYFKKEKNIQLYWTFHDCWAFTGYCTNFSMIKCGKWKVECDTCPQYKEYSWFFDRSKELFLKKKALFEGLNLKIITPSVWLANLVRESFLKEYPIKIINNGIDLSVFKPTESDFRKKYKLENKIVVLGVSFAWGRSKGLDVFVELSKRLDSIYQIVLVGIDHSTAKKLPENIIKIQRTHNQKELAAIYTAADIFANPTRQDNYPTVNMESMACGTPVITFRTGGSPEMLIEDYNEVVECDDIDMFELKIRNMGKKKKEVSIKLQKKAQRFDMNNCFQEYVDMYFCKKGEEK